MFLLNSLGLRTMAAVLSISDEGRPVTVRAVAERAKLSHGVAQRSLYKLRLAGLITQPGMKAGAIVPRYRMSIYREALQRRRS